MTSSVVRIQKTAGKDPNSGQVSFRLRDLSALVVLLLMFKNASWSVTTGHFVDPAPCPSVLWWYALCAVHLALTTAVWPRFNRFSEALAAVAAWGGCGGALALACYSLPAGTGLAGEPVAAWYDHVQLALAFVCARFSRAVTASRRG